jgi:hypothetical protein
MGPILDLVELIVLDAFILVIALPLYVRTMRRGSRVRVRAHLD